MSSGPPSILPGGQPAGVTNANMLFYIDMGLIAVLGLVTLIYLPRTIARYSTKSTLREGWMLLRGNSRYPPSRLSTVLKNKQLETPNASTIQYPPHLQTDTPPAASTMSHIYGVSTINDGFLASKERLGSGSPPPHVRGDLSRFPIVARVLEYHILGYRVGQLIVSTTYLALMCFAMFYQSDPGSNVMRAGFVAMSQMPIVFALGTKNSVVTALTGISYEQLNFLHRWVGQIMFIATLIHFIGWLVMWARAGTMNESVRANVWGLVAFVAICFSALGSHPLVRARLYTFFWHSHIIGLLAFMIGVWRHQPVVGVPYVATCVALYGADQLVRLAKTRVRKAILEPVPELGCTHVYIPRLDKGWVAGQHVRIRVLSFGVGIFGWTEAHPFTIANASNDVYGGLSLVCKKAGDWTSALYRMANQKSNGDGHRSVYVLVEGPYGGPRHTIIPSFSGVMLVLGGSGITFGTSVLEDLVAKSLDGTARTMCVNFVWVVRHPSAADPHLPSFVEIVQRAASVPNLKLTLSVFYTRGSDNAFALRTTLPSNIQIRSGRPDLEKELQEMLQNTCTSIVTTNSPRNGVLLAGCGPEGLISSVYAAKAGATTEIQKVVGGLELHTETFGW